MHIRVISSIPNTLTTMKNTFLLALGVALLAATPFGASAQSPYSDTYFNRASLKKEAEDAKAQREAEEARQREYEEALATSQAPVKEEIKKPEDFASYAEYREYLDGLGKRTTTTASSVSKTTQSSTQTTASGTVVNNYYVNTDPIPTTTTTVVYDPWWDSPSLTMALFFDPWYCTSYRVRYYRPSYSYWYDPFWHSPWGWSYWGGYSWNYGWGYNHGYGNGYRDGYWDGYRDGYYDGGYGYYIPPQPPLRAPRERVIGAPMPSTTASMSGYGRVQRSATAQQARTDSYYRNQMTTRRDEGFQSSTRGNYTPNYTRPESGNSRSYNDGASSWQQTTRREQNTTQTTRRDSYATPQSGTRGSYNNNSSPTRTYSAPTRSNDTPTRSSYSSPQSATRGSNNSGSSSSNDQSTRRSSGNSGSGSGLQQTTRR